MIDWRFKFPNLRLDPVPITNPSGNQTLQVLQSLNGFTILQKKNLLATTGFSPSRNVSFHHITIHQLRLVFSRSPYDLLH